MKPHLLLLAFLALFTPGCSDIPVDRQSLSRQREDLYKFEDREVTVVGHASANDDGPAVVLADGTRLYAPELKEWPANRIGRTVTVRGVLRRSTPTGSKGGSVDERFMLQGVRWSPGDLAKKDSRENSEKKT
jgi:hypothetical protein